jgi:hypothetical protein
MKKLASVLALALMIVGLTGCIDGQDDNGGKLPSKTQSSVSF